MSITFNATPYWDMTQDTAAGNGFSTQNANDVHSSHEII